MNRLPYPPRLLLLPLLVLAVGCSEGEPRPQVYPVSGQLRINGQPAEGALLSLHPIDGENFDQRGSRPWATVQSDGRFAISTYGEADGAPAGEYAVSVVWLDDPNSANPTDRLGGQYARPEQSEWRVQIVEGTNSLEPYEIDRARLLGPARPEAGGGSIDPPE